MVICSCGRKQILFKILLSVYSFIGPLLSPNAHIDIFYRQGLVSIYSLLWVSLGNQVFVSHCFLSITDARLWYQQTNNRNCLPLWMARKNCSCFTRHATNYINNGWLKIEWVGFENTLQLKAVKGRKWCLPCNTCLYENVNSNTYITVMSYF